MAMRTPPSYLQNGSHPAENDRLTMQALYATTGIVGASSLAVTAQGTPNMTVNVAAGWAAIVGTTQTNMGAYVGYNDATAVLTITTANATNPRIDLVCMTVNDAYYSGSTNNVVLQVIAGTPAVSPVAPTLPANSISLATIAVGANVTSISAGNITDTRVQVTSNMPFVSLTGVQTLTNKTLTSPVIASISNSGTLTLPNTTDTLVGRATTDTLTNKTLTSPVFNNAAIEAFTGVGTGFAGYTFYASTNNAIQWIGTNATANGAINIAWTAGIPLNTQLATGQSVTVTLAVQNGATAYYPTSIQIDGTTSGVTTKWSGGTAPTSGNANSTDVYTFSCLKTGSAAWLVFASQTKFA